MEQMLQKMARQLDALDEASLMALWDKYSTLANHFEPSKRWEEAVLILSLIQAKHWKNQLFNQRFAASVRPAGKPESIGLPVFSLEQPDEEKPKQHARILTFRPAQNESEKEPPDDSSK